MNNNDFLNKLRILFGGEENWTDQPEGRTYRAANDTSLYNTDMRIYDDGTEYSPYPDEEFDAWATNWGSTQPDGSQVRFRKDPGKEAVTDVRYTSTANDGGDTIDSMGNVTKGNKTSNVHAERAKNQEAKANEQRNNDFIGILRGLFGLFDNKR